MLKLLRIFGLHDGFSTHFQRIDDLLVYTHWLMALLFVGWGAFFLFTLWRFSARRSPQADHLGVKGHASKYAEYAVIFFELILLFGLAIPAWRDQVNAMPNEGDVLSVRVSGEQFQWNFHYPGPDGVFGITSAEFVDASTNPAGLDKSDPNAKDDFVSMSELVVPVDAPVRLTVTSKDVVHSFGVPLLRIKHDAIPGAKIPLSFTATATSEEIALSMAKNLPTYVDPDQAAAPPVNWIALEDHPGVVAAGEMLTAEHLDALFNAHIDEIKAMPRTPVEVACSQLCGLGHYKMKGVVTILPPDKFAEWLAAQSK